MTTPVLPRLGPSMLCAGCDGEMVITKDAIGRDSKKGPQCPRCTNVSVAKQGSIPELRGRSQAQWAPPIAPPTLPKHRSALVVQPAYSAFVEVPERPAPIPSKYVKTEAETHPKDLPADHPRRIAYLARVKETRARKRADKRAQKRDVQA